MATKESGGQEHASRSAEDAAVESAEATEQDASTANVAERKAELDADVDAILDEIDEALEENAEEFVRGFVQKGGQ